jgi:hypothetical protein
VAPAQRRTKLTLRGETEHKEQRPVTGQDN